MQSQKNIEFDVTITFTSAEFAFIQGFIYAAAFMNYELPEAEREKDKAHIDFVDRLYDKFESFQNQSGDACRHPVQSPDAVGQGGTNG